MAFPSIISVLLLFLFTSDLAQSTTFTISNSCSHPIWPGFLSNAGNNQLATTGFYLQPGESRAVVVPHNWSGRMWARTLCGTDPSSGRFSCRTGDCGSGQIECSGGGATPPATLAEFTLSGSGGLDFYDVSLVDGYNLPAAVVPEGGKCIATGCAADLNVGCPPELRVVVAAGNGAAVACKSACEAFRTAQYCCSGEYGKPETCRPTAYSGFFKSACPRAYSYAYDDPTSTFTCPAGGNYLIAFCPTTSTPQKMAGDNPKAAMPLMNNTMVYLGGALANEGPPPSLRSSLAVFLAAVMWWLVVEEFL